MTLQPGQRAPDFVQASTDAGTAEQHAPTPSQALVNADLAASAGVPLVYQAEIVPEAPAGMWGY